MYEYERYSLFTQYYAEGILITELPIHYMYVYVVWAYAVSGIYGKYRYIIITQLITLDICSRSLEWILWLRRSELMTDDIC